METRRWTSQIDEITAEFKTEFGTMGEKTLNKRPNSDSWSIGQNLEHLITVSRSYYPIPDKIRSKDYKLNRVAQWSFFAKTVGNMILGSVERSRKRRVKTFPVWEPTPNSDNPNIYREFIAEQEQLKVWINSLDELLDKNVVIGSPANQNICYKLQTALDIIIEHQRRHYEQCLELKNSF